MPAYFLRMLRGGSRRGPARGAPSFRHLTYLKADTHYPYVRPVHTGRLYGPYVRVTGVEKCTRMYGTYGPSIQYGPYVRYVRVHFRHPYLRAVITGVKNAPVRTAVRTGRTYG